MHNVKLYQGILNLNFSENSKISPLKLVVYSSEVILFDKIIKLAKILHKLNLQGVTNYNGKFIILKTSSINTIMTLPKITHSKKHTIIRKVLTLLNSIIQQSVVRNELVRPYTT